MLKIKTINAAFLIIGTSIGAGILGLPVDTAGGGFYPSILFLALNWLIMTATALMFIEVLDTYKHNANFITLSDKILGPFCKVLTFVVYILLFMSLTLAYVKGGGVFLSDFFNQIPLFLGCLLFLVALVPLIVLGSKILGYGNSILTCGLILSFLALISLGITKISSSMLKSHFDWKLAVFSYPMYIASFGFHSVLPSLNTYVKNKKSLRIAVVIGTTTTFVIYLVWQLFIMGLVPLTGLNSLTEALAADQTAITPLRAYLNSPFLTLCAQVFYFTALTTSFLGVGLGLMDFLIDSFKIKRKLVNRLFLSILIYVPALWIARTDLRIFYLSLKYGGGIACFYLLILLPILLFLRYNRSKKAL